MTAPVRILVTGSRHLLDRRRVFDALDRASAGQACVIVHGAARGADALAAEWAAVRGRAVEVHPADWTRHGRAAGPLRNQLVVDAGADLCLAFPAEDSRGTWDPVRRARLAGIRVTLA